MASTMTKTSMETVEKIAKDLVAKCRKQQFEEAVKAHYAQNVVCIEPQAMGDTPREVRGMQAVLDKGKRWADSSEVHKVNVSDPLIAGSYFSVKFTIDATCKQSKERMTMDEIAFYHVQNGKIDRVEFMYDCDSPDAGDTYMNASSSSSSASRSSSTAGSMGASPSKSTGTSGSSPMRTAGGTETSTHNMSMSSGKERAAVNDRYADVVTRERKDEFRDMGIDPNNGLNAGDASPAAAPQRNRSDIGKRHK